MPTKGRQRASRQAQLRKNSKKSSGKNTRVVDSRPENRRNETRNTDMEPVVAEKHSSKAERISIKSMAPKVIPQAPSTHQDPGALEYPYLKSELRQIGLTSGLIIIAFIGLTFIPWG